MSSQAAEHFAHYRVRCIKCHQNFCKKKGCLASPYHLGKTCEEYQIFKEARYVILPLDIVDFVKLKFQQNNHEIGTLLFKMSVRIALNLSLNLVTKCLAVDILAVVSLFNFRIQRWESLSSLFKLKLRELQTIKIEWSKRFLILHYLRDWYTFCKTLRSFRLQSLLSSQLYNEKNQCWISRTENYIQLCRVPSMPVLDKCNLSPGYFFKNGLYFTTIWISESQGSLTVKTWRTW